MGVKNIIGALAIDGALAVNDIPVVLDSKLEFTLSADGTYYTCTGIGVCADTDIVIPAKFNGKPVTTIGERAFYDNDTVASVIISSGITHIEKEAFSGCSVLNEISIPDTVLDIGSLAFYFCPKIEKIYFNAKNTTVSAASDWEGIKGSFSTIGASGNGIKIIIGKDCVQIPKYCFYDYSYSDTWKSPIIGVQFENGSCCESIGDSAFYGCSSLTSIAIPDSVANIGGWAFSKCTSLTNITIPDSVTSIGERAFAYCDNLTIYCEAPSRPEGWDVNWKPNSRPVVWGYIMNFDGVNNAINSIDGYLNLADAKTIAECRGYYYDAVYFDTANKTVTFCLCNEQVTDSTGVTVLTSLDTVDGTNRPNCEWATSVVVDEETGETATAYVSYANNTKQYRFEFEIDSERPYLVTIKSKDDKIPFSSIMELAADDMTKDDFAIFSVEQPLIGAVDLKWASFATGFSVATGTAAFASGTARAYGDMSHAEGWGAIAYHHGAHAEGRGTKAYGNSSHTEGHETEAYNHYAHAEGDITRAKGNAAHSEGVQTKATARGAHAEGGSENVDADTISWTDDVELSYIASNASQSKNENGKIDHSRILAGASGEFSHSEGYNTSATTSYAHAEGQGANARGKASHAEGQYTQTIGAGAHAEGYNTLAKGDYAHAEGKGTEALVKNSHAEGEGTKAYSYWAHAEGKNTVAGNAATEANGRSAHAEGNQTEATRDAAHAEGYKTQATGKFSHAEGSNTTASGEASHAGGRNSRALYENSFVHGENLITGKKNQFVIGENNTLDERASFVIGANDDYSGDTYNAFTVTPCTGHGTELKLGDYFSIEAYDTVPISSSDTESYTSINTPGLTFDYTCYQDHTQTNLETGDIEYLGGIECDLNLPGLSYIYHALGIRNPGADDRIYESRQQLQIFDSTFTPEQLQKLVNFDANNFIGQKGNGENAVLLNKTGDAAGKYAVATGYNTEASGNYSFAGGQNTKVLSGNTNAFAYGIGCIVNNAEHSVAMGRDCITGNTAKANYSVAMGEGCTTNAYHSAAIGKGLQTNKPAQMVVGQYNAIDTKASFIVGNGASDTDRKNVFTTGFKNNENYITVGNTTITETQLQKVLALLDNYTITAVNQ